MKVYALLLVATGCVPMVSPPVHGRIGGGYVTPKIPRTQPQDGRTELTRTNGTFQVGLDSSAIVEQPVVLETGVVTDFERGGFFLDGGVMRRLLPKVRVSATGGSEYWWGDHHGVGVRSCVTLEYVGQLIREAGSEYDPGNDGTHNQTTTYMARTGSFGIGAFVDVGYRWIDDDPNYAYIMFGLSFRLAAMAGVVDVSGQH